MRDRFPVRGAQRGQAIVETALFMPIMLLLILSIVYLSQAGVAQERGQAAVRYGSLVSPVQNYSLPAVYAAYDAGLSSPIPYTSPTTCPGTAATDVAAAINQQQALPSSAPTSYPTTQPFWTVPSPVANCSMGERQISHGFFPGLTVGYVEMMTNTVSASMPMPNYLKKAIGSAVGINATMTLYLPLTVKDLIYCTPGLQGTIVGRQQWSATSGNASANPLEADLDINNTLWPSYTATPPPTWNSSNDDSFNYQADTGMGSGPRGCENY
jgi:hypothetical protein